VNKPTKKKRNTRPRKFMRREYGPSYFAEKMAGFADAARKIAKEEKILDGPLATERIQ